MDVTKPTLPATVTSVRASNRSGSSTNEHDHGLPNPAVRERDIAWWRQKFLKALDETRVEA